MPVTFYELRSRGGALAAVHKRVDRLDGGKDVLWLLPDGRPGLDGTPASELPLFNIHLVDSWEPSVPIILAEGEKVAQALVDAGFPAVGTVTGAASTPSLAVLADLAGRAVICSPDADEPGRRHMRRVAQLLEDVAAVGWLEPPTGVSAGWDLADAIAEGRDVRALLATATEPPAHTGEEGETSETSPDLPSPTSLVSQQSWPAPLAPEAFHGLAGDFTRAVEPFTEADPAALLASFLVTAGALAGPRVHALAGNREHPARLFTLIVGDTSKGRKGTSGAPTESLARLADPEFSVARGGLSSGEGVIYHVRDAVEKMTMVGKGADRHPELQVVDEGVADKRLQVVESEFASVLRVLQRDGNTLSAVLRTAWESGELRTLTRNAPLVATGAHVTILGHVSREELVRYLDRTDLANGFVNRFVIIAARRQRLLPEGGSVPDGVLAGFAEQLRAVLAWAREPRPLARDDEAARMWAAVYPELSEGRPGLLGAATNRAEAQALRLQVVYALLDRSPVIRPEHVLASLALWRYADESARWVFGDALGDTIADAILAAVRARGELSRTDISNLFGRHVERSRIEQALVALLTAARLTRVVEATAGRPRELYRA